MTLGPSPAPRILSWFARATILLIAGALAVYYYHYWDNERHDHFRATITLLLSIVECCGLSIACFRCGSDKRWGYVGILLCMIAATWGLVTMYDITSTEHEQQAALTRRANLSYVTATRELTDASSAITAVTREEPPIGAGPQTIAAWENVRQASLARLYDERDRAAQEIARIDPLETFDWFALLQSIGIELFPLLGFPAFGLFSARREQIREPSQLLSRMWRRVKAAFKQTKAISVTVTPGPGRLCVSGGQVEVKLDSRSQAWNMRDGWSVQEIAAILSVSKYTVWRWFREIRAMT